MLIILAVRNFKYLLFGIRFLSLIIFHGQIVNQVNFIYNIFFTFLTYKASMANLNIDDVCDIQVEKAMANRSVYKEILKNVNDKIVWGASRGALTITYYIRPLQPNKPIINTQNALNYIKNKLERNGFRVDHFSAAGTVMLVVSWKVDRLKVLQKLASHCVKREQSSLVF
jgi:hypothetical protein